MPLLEETATEMEFNVGILAAAGAEIRFDLE